MLGVPKIKRRMAVAMLLAATATVAGACGSGEDRPGNANAPGSGSASGSGTHTMEHEHAKPQFGEGEETSTVELTLKDYVFDGVPAETKGENVLFEARVATGQHELEVVGADGKPLGEIAPFEPDDGTKELALKLAPGTYTLQCLLKEGARTHKELGMVATLTVT